MKKILLLGNGAREHVIAETFLRSADRPEIFVVGKTKNPGLAKLAMDYLLADVCDRDAIREFAHKVKPDFAFVGPEAPIAYGITDMLLEMGIKSASPLQTVGRLESSKSFTRNLLEKYAIPGNPKFKVFFSEDGIREFLESLEGNYVVKADGLKGGKGVKVSGDHLANMDEGGSYAKECILECGKVVIEEKFIGQEFSLMSFCDGDNTKDMPAVQDHKRAFDGDSGPNTGGMGTYSCANHSMPFLTESDLRQAADITRLVAKALKQETQSHFKGIMYGGFIAVKDGVRLIEYNARFGDPEAMNVLPLLKSDFVEICEAIISGDLNNVKIEFENKTTVCKYAVPNGYPDEPVKGEKIEIGEMPEGVRMYFGSVDEKEDGLYLAGSRAVAVVGIGDDVSAAEKLAEEGVSLINGPVFHRKDIGTKALIDSKVEMMKEVRGA
ncbi:phosphoribosylamine--glycine ligase [Candidatus Peregrinibacteria bacterium CG_4_10_14_0_2_um_filter_38_24]|nr:MAG: phosphoribosylamine--glycine ligase [Candidatus Peregrinibacteria bacterium CG_4_10_14_0_2_um_filter_38_24]PJC39350.1 MAG: phosphoribosylamine--glycine ligase [Candidatus Peregrinibacteria bacterium CG_4_9_14_0_2_um_filter_38_9]